MAPLKQSLLILEAEAAGKARLHSLRLSKSSVVPVSLSRLLCLG